MRYLICAILFGWSAAILAAPAGHPTTVQASQTLHLPGKGKELPYQGKVLQAIPSNDYSYIEIASEEGRRWLAAPKISLRQGAMIRFGDGTLMRDFFSKKLQRAFPAVLFVSEVKVVGNKK